MNTKPTIFTPNNYFKCIIRYYMDFHDFHLDKAVPEILKELVNLLCEALDKKKFDKLLCAPHYLYYLTKEDNSYKLICNDDFVIEVYKRDYLWIEFNSEMFLLDIELMSKNAIELIKKELGR